jgi:hypothetical protein
MSLLIESSCPGVMNTQTWLLEISVFRPGSYTRCRRSELLGDELGVHVADQVEGADEGPCECEDEGGQGVDGPWVKLDAVASSIVRSL